MLLSNPKNLRREIFPNHSHKKKYLEILLSEVANGYTKGSSLKFSHFLEGVNLAIEQEKVFEEDDVALQANLGNNIGILLKMMKSKESVE